MKQILFKQRKRTILILTKTTPSRAASAKMSAQDTVALQLASTRVLIVSITSKPLAEFRFGPAFFSPVKVAVSSSSIDASQPYKTHKKKKKSDHLKP